MSEFSALRRLSDAKSLQLLGRDYLCAGDILYRKADQSYAIAVLGRVRYLSESELLALLSAPDETDQ